jgi:predicted dehydrogenase
MIDLGVHYFDLVLYLMGLPIPSYIAGGTHQTYAHSPSRNRNGYVGNKNGIFSVNRQCGGFFMSISMYNRSGTLHFNHRCPSHKITLQANMLIRLLRISYPPQHPVSGAIAGFSNQQRRSVYQRQMIDRLIQKSH